MEWMSIDPFHTIHHLEQKFSHFCSEYVLWDRYGAGPLWDLEVSSNKPRIYQLTHWMTESAIPKNTFKYYDLENMFRLLLLYFITILPQQSLTPATYIHGFHNYVDNSK